MITDYMAKMHVHNNPLLSLQPWIFGIFLGLKCRMVRDCAREVSLAPVYKLYTDVCLCGSAQTSGWVVDGLSTMTALWVTSAWSSIWSKLFESISAWTAVSTRRIFSTVMITASIVNITLSYIWGHSATRNDVLNELFYRCHRRHQCIQGNSHSVQCWYCTFRWHKVADISLE